MALSHNLPISQGILYSWCKVHHLQWWWNITFHIVLIISTFCLFFCHIWLPCHVDHKGFVPRLVEVSVVPFSCHSFMLLLLVLPSICCFIAENFLKYLSTLWGWFKFKLDDAFVILVILACVIQYLTVALIHTSLIPNDVSIFSCAFWPLVYYLWINVYSDILFIFLVRSFVFFDLWKIFLYSRYKSNIRHIFWKYFLSFCVGEDVRK